MPPHAGATRPLLLPLLSLLMLRLRHYAMLDTLIITPCFDVTLLRLTGLPMLLIQRLLLTAPLRYFRHADALLLTLQALRLRDALR